MVQVKQKISSIEKALEIILSFQPRNHEKSIAEISRDLNLHHATATRIVNSLTQYKFLYRNPFTKKFKLGQSAVDIGFTVNQSINWDLVLIAKPHLDYLSKKVNEKFPNTNTVMEILVGAQTTLGYVAKGPGYVTPDSRVGHFHPVHSTAGGKAMLAFMPQELRKKYFSIKIENWTQKTLTDQEILQKHLKEIRKHGFAFDNEGVYINTNGVGVPILGRNNETIAAVTIVGISTELTDKKAFSIVPIMKDVAEKISKDLKENEVPYESRAII